MRKHTLEEHKKIPKNISNLTENDENSNKFIGNLGNLKEGDKEIDDEKNEEVEDTFTIINKTHKNYRTGNESASEYDPTPKQVLDEYGEFN